MRTQGWGAQRRSWAALSITAALAVLGSVAVPQGAAHRDDEPRKATIGSAAAKDPALRAEGRRAVRRMRAMERHWGSPAAERQRDRSRGSYRGATPAEALRAASRWFPELLDDPLWRGPKLQPGDEIDRYLGDHSAVIDQPDGPNLFIESTTPLRARDDDGRKRPIDVNLERAGDHLEPGNTLVETEIGVDLSDGVDLGRSGLSFAPATTAATSAPRIDGDKAFFARSAPDTDFLVAALPDGVETFWQLRSPRSPERHALHFDLPEGAQLRLAEGGGSTTTEPQGQPPRDPATRPDPRPGETPGAEIVRGDDRLATILPPSARDAQGRPVALALEVAGSTLTVRVPHRGADVAYPIMVDPTVREEWWWRDDCGNFDYSGWRPQRVWEGSQWNFYGSGCSFWGNGLYIWTNDQAWTNYQHDEWGEWVWPAYPNTSVVRADFGQMNHIPRSVEWGEPAWTGTCIFTYIWSNSHGAQNSHSECGALSGHWDTACTGSPPCAHNNTSHGNAAVFNLRIIGTGYRYNPAWAFLGAAILTLHDFNVPRITGLASAPSGAWVHDTSHSFRVNAHDDGLGVKEIVFDGPGIWDWRTHNCSGNRHWRCPYDWQSDGNPFSYNTSGWGEGTHQLRARVFDPVNNPGDASGNRLWESPENRHIWHVRVDRTPPSWTGFSGALSQRGKWFKDGSHQLTVNARDTLSGTQYAELRVDGARVDTPESRSCDANGCPQDMGPRTFTWNTSGYAEGAHEIRPYVRDPLNHARSDDFWQAKLDRSAPTIAGVTGRFANNGDWVSEGKHDITVDARDPFSGVQKVELFVDDKLEDTETASCPNGQCPNPFPAPLTWDTAGDTDGPHAIRVVVTDLVGHPHTRTWTAHKDAIRPLALITGELWDSHGQLVRQPSTLEIEAFDEDGTKPTSGIKSIEVKIDDVRAYFDSQTCTAQPCGMFREWTFNPATVADGDHSAEVIVTDIAGGEHVAGVGFTSQNLPARPPETTDLAAHSGARADGAAADDHAGTAVTRAGDLNGDELDDYAIGAPNADGPNGLDAGAVHVVFGDGTGSAVDLAAPGARGYRIDGAALRDRAGTAVANAGDVNGDGVDDLAIGAPQAGDDLPLVPVQGHVYVVFGSPDGGDVNLASLGTRGFRVDGPVLPRAPLSPTYDGRPRDFGSYLAGAESGLMAAGADVNGDERDDLVIGSSPESANGRAQSGSTYVVFGKADATPVDVAALGAGGFRIDGAAPGELSGYAAAPVGDTNDDGLGDVALTAPGTHATGRTNAGTAYLVFGKVDGATVDLAALGAQGYAIRGSSGDKLGSSVASLGDLDGDTRQDLAVGGRGALIVLGKDDTAAVDPEAGSWEPGYQRVTAPAGVEYDHALVNGGGDLDDDALPDLLVGFPDAAGTRGELYTVYGRGRGASAVALGTLAGQDGTRIVGATPGDAAGRSADTIDFRTSTASGVIVGAPGATANGRSGSGSAYTTPSSSSASSSQSMQAAAVGAAEVPSSKQYQRVGAKKCYRHRFPPFGHDHAKDSPGCRTTLRRKTTSGDKVPRNSNSRRVPRKPFNPTHMISIVDSEKDEFARMRQTGPREFEVFDANGLKVGTATNTEVQVVGRGCMKTKDLSKAYTLMRLMHSKLGFTGLMLRTSLPSKSLVGVNRKSDRRIRDRHGDGLDNGDIIEHYYAPCGNHSALSKMRAIASAPTTVEDQPFVARGANGVGDLYQGSTVENRTDVSVKCDTVYNPSCGGEYDNYFSPHWPDTVLDESTQDPADRIAVLQPNTVHLSTATTGVGPGGGLVNAVLRHGWVFSYRDRIEYVDPNVPCTRQYIGRWWFGLVTRPGWERSQKTWGWLPRREARPAVPNTHAKYEGPDRRYSGQADDPREPSGGCPPQPPPP